MRKMKSIVAIAISFLLVWCSVAQAESDDVIEFMDIPWDTPAYVYVTDVRMNMELRQGNPELEDFEVIGDNFVMLDVLGHLETGCGFQLWIFPTLEAPCEDFYVAGYPVLDVKIQSVFNVENGSIDTSPISSRVVQAEYSLETERLIDPLAAIEDLHQKLIVKYGEQYDTSEKESSTGDGTIYYACKWERMNTFVKLSYCIDADGALGYLNITYGINNAQDYIDQIRHPETTVVKQTPDIDVDPDNTDNL